MLIPLFDSSVIIVLYNIYSLGNKCLSINYLYIFIFSGILILQADFMKRDLLRHKVERDLAKVQEKKEKEGKKSSVRPMNTEV